MISKRLFFAIPPLLALAAAGGQAQVAATAGTGGNPGSEAGIRPRRYSLFDPNDASYYAPGRLMGLPYWAPDGNLVLARVGAFHKVQPWVGAYDMEVLEDARGTLKPGTHISVGGNFLGLGFVMPNYDEGAICLIGFSAGKRGFLEATYGGSPLGWHAPRLIPQESVEPVKAALQLLHTILPKGVKEPLDHAKALELLQGKDYETWAVGLSMLAAEDTPADEEIIAGIFADPKTDLKQALWAYSASKDIMLDDTDIADNQLLFYVQDRCAQLGIYPRVVPPKDPVNVDQLKSDVMLLWEREALTQSGDGSNADPRAAARFTGPAYWDHGADLILGKVATVDTKPGEKSISGCEIGVLGDLRGAYPAGAKAKVGGEASAVMFSMMPPLDKGTLVLLPVQPGDDKALLAYASNLACPIGWRAPRIIPQENLEAIKAGLQALRGVLPEHADDPLDHAKALELLKSKTYETWAIGVSMLTAEKTPENSALLSQALASGFDLSIPQALWLIYLSPREPETPGGGWLRPGTSLSELLEWNSRQLGPAWMGSEIKPTPDRPQGQGLYQQPKAP